MFELACSIAILAGGGPDSLPDQATLRAAADSLRVIRERVQRRPVPVPNHDSVTIGALTLLYPPSRRQDLVPGLEAVAAEWGRFHQGGETPRVTIRADLTLDSTTIELRALYLGKPVGYGMVETGRGRLARWEATGLRMALWEALGGVIRIEADSTVRDWIYSAIPI